MARRKIVVGSRESKLAVLQTRIVMDSIKRHNPDIELELITMKTTGDKILDRTLDKVGGKGLFVKELDMALMEGRIDLSVHSLKDMPMETPGQLPLVALSEREDPRDVLIYPFGEEELDKSKCIGTSSFRRKLLLRNLYPDVGVDWIRGNLQTRLSKLDSGQFSAIVLAAAGIKRLGLEHRIGRFFSTDEVIPPAGQGVLAVQGRAGEDYSFLENVNNKIANYTSDAERSFVRTLNGGCSSPVAAYAIVHGNEIKLRGLYYNEETEQYTIGETVGDVKDGIKLGEELALKLRKEG
ncbi:hydroxymethylbilane synthase [Clostridium cylindrosporum]|uniref:Porphobilinogen deaminase n=1 Tax=Clostridium cylindrosporum DSM 605 TaxID=1121307 RepID=A0A0J8DC13_CLOCY|nr:hydroxymethylbilane synthase [Clostridium cylindrosporum]KMT21839.1 porphobilinogen deaminase HemC [Clostridium cylindrosporum DSM 605]